MSKSDQNLVIHPAGSREPLVIPVQESIAMEINPRLAALMRSGETEEFTAADGRKIVVNFAHIAAAQLEPTKRGPGF